MNALTETELYEAKNWWHDRKILVTNPQNGKQVVLQAKDWGPAEWTGRVIDVSKTALDALGAVTDDIVNIEFADQDANLGPVSTTPTPILMEKTIEVTHEPAIPIPGQPVFGRMTVSYNWIHDDTYVVSKIHCESGGFVGVAAISIWDCHSSVWRPIWSADIFSFGGDKERTYYPKLDQIEYGGNIYEGISVDAFDAMNIYIMGWAGISISIGPFIPPPFFETDSACFQPDYTEVPDLPVDSQKLKLAHLCSPAELRVHDSQDRVTGLVNGDVKEEIPDSIYDAENEAVMILSSSNNDYYHYEIIGIENGNYGFTVDSLENGEATTFTLTDVPTSAGTIHQFTIDWDALSQGESSVTMQIDSEGDGVFEQIITIQPPIASFTFSPENPVAGEEIAFDASESYDADGEIVSYEWDFGDGTNSSGKVATHTYSTVEDYTVTLAVTDDDGALSTYQSLIQIQEREQELPTWAWVAIAALTAVFMLLAVIIYLRLFKRPAAQVAKRKK